MSRLIIGAMSGTSADGVDAALVRITGSGQKMAAELLGLASRDYPADLRGRIMQIRQAGQARLREMAELARDVGRSYARVVRDVLDQTQTSPDKVCAIAAHGQTMFHDPPLTMQVMDPAILAWETGIDVISDFRRADCAAGGQGAPLVPFADQILFRAPGKNRVVLNIGGIANITVLYADDRPTLAFDTGPGNCLLDQLCGHMGKPFDDGGAFAARGQGAPSVVAALMVDPYFGQAPPKSTDGPAMIGITRGEPSWKTLPLLDQIATATHWTVESIAVGIERFAGTTIDQVILAGGGAKNRTMMHLLTQRLGREVTTSDQIGIPTQAREAMAFAILGAATLDRVPANIVSVTGAARPVVLGAITPRP